jgi:hypothetical protein
MDQKQFLKIAYLLNLNLQVPTKGNVPDSLLQKGDGQGSDMLANRISAKGTTWTLEDHFNLVEVALANGASFADADNYCNANCNGMTFGALYNFIQLLHSPLVA